MGMLPLQTLTQTQEDALLVFAGFKLTMKDVGRYESVDRWRPSRATVASLERRGLVRHQRQPALRGGFYDCWSLTDLGTDVVREVCAKRRLALLGEVRS